MVSNYNTDKNTVIERPWEEGACEKCYYCFQEDMCSAYRLITSYAYCPHVRNCEKFYESIFKQRRI